MTYAVTRQHYWGVDEPLVVEIASGGLDYANADMLCDDKDRKYARLGCDQEYTDPREALNAAIAVRDEWVKHPRYDETEEPLPSPRIECGYTGGNTIPFEEYPSDDNLREWAEKEWEAIPKCDQCGEPLGKERFSWFGRDWEDDEYCSPTCSENAWDRWVEENTNTWICPDCGCENRDSDAVTSNPICEDCLKSFDWDELEEEED